MPFANPEYAFSAGKRLVSTAAATARTDAVRIGNALRTTEAIAAAIPAAKFGKPEDVAAAVVFLASQEAGYITGETVHVNGGMVMV